MVRKTQLLKAEHKLALSDRKGTLYTIDPAKATLPSWPETPPKPEPAIQPATGEAPEPEAQAKATPPPQPAPIPEEPLTQGRLALRVLAACWRWLKDSWEDEEYIGDDYYHTRRTRRRFKRWGWVVAVLAAALAIVAPPAWRRGSALVASTLAQITAPAPAPPLHWRSRKPGAIFWDFDCFRFSVPLLETKGDQYRMRVSLSRYSEYFGGCSVDSVIVADAAGRKLLRWNPTGVRVYGKDEWTSEVLSFRAPAGARKLLVGLDLQDSRFLCHPWQVPVDFK